MSIHWLIIQALILEGLGIASLNSDLPLNDKLLLFVGTHGPASGILSLVLWRLLPKRYRDPKAWTMSFLFGFQFLLPFIGAIGLFSSMLLALYIPRVRIQFPWKNTEIAELPFKAMDLDTFPIYSHGGLIQILKDAVDPNKRLKAVMSTKQMPERAAIGLLRFALKDPIDDVRLLAYSMLDEKEKKLSEKISHNLIELETTKDPKLRLQLEQLIANKYWEMIYLDLVHGGVRTHVLTQAKKHIELAISLEESISSLKLYGRILLAGNDFPRAKAIFEEAIKKGIPVYEVSPFLAEIAFLTRDFASIPNYLKMFQQHEKSTPNFQPVLRYWLHEAAVQGES